MGCGLLQRRDLTPLQKPAQLHLLGGAAGLGHDRARHQWHDAAFQANAVLRPNAPFIPLGGDQNASVVHGRLHGLRFAGRRLGARRRRAAASSCGVSAPCSASHSATAARPSRSRRARRAAAVIQAETLRPSASAARSSLACTPASTVMASFTAGLPRGIRKPYYRGSMVARALPTYLPALVHERARIGERHALTRRRGVVRHRAWLARATGGVRRSRTWRRTRENLGR